MKIKEKRQEASDTFQLYWWFKTAGVITTSGDNPTSVPLYDREIIYGVGPDRTVFRPCTHSKWEMTHVQKIGFNFVSQVDPKYTGYTDWIPYTNLTKSRCLEFLDMYAPVPDLDAFCTRAVSAMTPSMATGFQGANFLLELKELPALWRWAKDRLGALIDLRRSCRNLTGKQLLDNASNDTLAYSFGIKPLMSDILSLHEGLTSFKTRLSNLRNNAGKPQRRHYTEKLPAANVKINVAATNGNDDLVLTFAPTVLTATCEYSYTLPELSALELQVKGMLDTLGLDINANVIWNAIPFSFVIDWFFNVSDFLEQFSTRWIEPTMKIGSFGYSIKREVAVSQSFLRTFWSGSTKAYMGTRTQGHRCKYTSYVRKACAPSPHWFTVENTGGVTGRKILLGSLLIKQRLK